MDRLNKLKFKGGRNSQGGGSEYSNYDKLPNVNGRIQNNDYDYQSFTLLRRNSQLPNVQRNNIKEITDDSLEIREAVESLNQVVLNAQKKLNDLTGRQDNYASYGTDSSSRFAR